MQLVNAPRVAAASGALLALVFAPGTNAGEDNNEDEVGRFRPKFAQEFAVGGISRVGGRDPRLTGQTCSNIASGSYKFHAGRSRC